MKVGLSLVTMMVSFAAQAQSAETICRAQVVSAGCGNGKIEVRLSESSYKFVLNNGDVGCWNDHYRLTGQALSVGSVHPYHGKKRFELKVGDPITNLPVEFGTLIYDAQENLARLETHIQPAGVLSTKYDLICE